ncbi:transferrin [Fopius arisanus]|uniref:TRF_2 protein n=1 Tax=Fopius arisanus TaxID=64838 RepID=A0A0C9R5K1_9HYME|nr:PREDICTED: transferrin-like [Fopius arisanus]
MFLLFSTSHLYLFIWVTFALAITQSSGRLRLCVVRSVHTGKIIMRNCQHVENDAIDCVIVSDRLQCLRIVSNGRADFAVLEPEDLFAGMTYEEAPVLVTHELRLFPTEASNYEMIVLVNNKIRSFSDLHDKRFCHPGYDATDSDWTPIFADYFQSQIIPKRCETRSTLLENRFAALSDWFQAGCFPGEWAFSSEKDVDRRLKSKYFNLCAVCNNGACHLNDKYRGRAGALMCLTEDAGDVAWVRLDDAKEHFKVSSSEYRILCPDGVARPLNSFKWTCTWISRPWPVVVARREIAERVARVVDGLQNANASWQTLLLQLLEGYKATPIRLDTLKTPEDFLHEFSGLSSAYAGSECHPSRTIRWCLSSYLEHNKCQWLKRAALSYGMEPEIQCLQLSGRDDALQGVASGFCHFFVAQPEELMTAGEKNLTAVLELIPAYHKQQNNIVILVMMESKHQRVEDLRGATACFTKYRSVAWNAFVALMGNRSGDSDWHCNGDRTLSNFFKNIVLPDHDVEDEEIVDATFQCLTSGRGDVAFLTLEDHFRVHPGVRRICVEDVSDPECILTWSTLGSVMISESLPHVRRREIVSLLEEMNTWFGVHYSSPTPAMTLYSPFDGHENIIFPRLTVSLVQNVSYLQLPRPYTEILQQLRATNHSTCGSSKSYDSIFIPVIAFPLINAMITY